jgi:hypothetical protein
MKKILVYILTLMILLSSVTALHVSDTTLQDDPGAVTGQFTIKNDGDYPLINISLATDAAAKYGITFENVPSELDLDESVQVTVKGTITDDLTTIAEKVADITVSAIGVETSPSSSSPLFIPDLDEPIDDAPETVTLTGSLEIITTPESATVFLDGVEQGTSPYTISNLTLGTYTVLLTLDGHENHTDTVIILEGDNTLNITLNEIVVVDRCAEIEEEMQITNINLGVTIRMINTLPSMFSPTMLLSAFSNGLAQAETLETEARSLDCSNDYTLENLLQERFDQINNIIDGGVSSSKANTLLDMRSELFASAQEFGFTLNVELTGSVEISTTPSDATVYLNDVDMGQTTITIHNIDLGLYDLRIELDGYQDHEEQIEITQAMLTMDIALDEIIFGALTVITTPSGATLTLDGVAQGTTPITIADLEIGSYNTTLTLTGYESFSTTVDVLEGNNNLHVNLIVDNGTPSTNETGSLAVTTTPIGATVSLDGVEKGTSPITITDIALGTYTLDVTLAGYDDITDTIEIFEGANTVDVTLTEITGNGTTTYHPVTETANLNMGRTSQLEIERLKVQCGDGSRESIGNGDTVDDVKPGDTCELTFYVYNNFKGSTDIDMYDVSIEVEGDEEVGEDDTDVDIDAGDRELITLEVYVDEDAERTTEDVIIDVYGRDSDDNLHRDEWTIQFRIRPDKHKLDLKSVSVSPKDVSVCSSNTVTITAKVENSGLRDEDDVVVEFNIPSLSFNKEVTGSIDEDDYRTFSVSIPVPKDTSAKTHTVTVKTYYDTNEFSDTKTTSFVVKSCGSGSNNLKVIGNKKSTTLTPKIDTTARDNTLYSQPIATEPKEGFMDGTGYAVLLILSNLIVVGLLVVLGIALVKNIKGDQPPKGLY